MKLPSGNIPRWIIFTIDLLLVMLSYAVAYLIRFDFNIPSNEWPLGVRFLGVFILTRTTFFILFKSFSGIIRYTSIEDTIRIFGSLVTGSLVMLGLNTGYHYLLEGELFLLPNSILFIEFLLSLVGLVIFRLSVKLLYAEFKNPQKVRIKVAIFGAGESGLITKQTIEQDPEAKMEIVAFFDDDKKKIGKKLEGVNIYGSNRLKDILIEKRVEQVILSIQNLNPDIKKRIAEEALEAKSTILNVPPVKKWIKGELSLKQLQSIKIEDLLGRTPIDLKNNKLEAELKNKRILVTGGAGSIGSELVRQIINYEPESLWIFDQAESALYDLQQELSSHPFLNRCEFAIGDITQLKRVENLMASAVPEIIFHAAAYKHVPLMELNPSEAVLTNLGGTKNLADAALKFQVKKFILISTDKAVNPTNVMGATKRAAEIYCNAVNEAGSTKFITTRFGNVLGSNGSVIPLFKKQIQNGGPVTVTHKEVTRFFMTIPESVQLVLEAGFMGIGGEVFVFDMGESIKIYDLAKKMLSLSGLIEGRDIEIEFTGLRPGEKLYEELLADSESTLETHHPKILRAKLKSIAINEALKEINNLLNLFQKQENQEIVKSLKTLVPEFKSKNSEYTKLDH